MSLIKPEEPRSRRERGFFWGASSSKEKWSSDSHFRNCRNCAWTGVKLYSPEVTADLTEGDRPTGGILYPRCACDRQRDWKTAMWYCVIDQTVSRLGVCPPAEAGALSVSVAERRPLSTVAADGHCAGSSRRFWETDTSDGTAGAKKMTIVIFTQNENSCSILCMHKCACQKREQTKLPPSSQNPRQNK